MKNFTQKMKSLLLVMAAMLFVAAPTKAEVQSLVDLFGKYKFSATIEYTEAGKGYQGEFKESADVTIEKDAVYDAQIVGLAGRTQGQKVNGWDGDTKTMKILNPSFGGVWGDLNMANAKGDYPLTTFKDGVTTPGYSTEYVYNSSDQSITIPDFTLGMVNAKTETFVVYAKFTNVKLSLVELDKIDLDDLSGDWHFKAGEGTYSTMEGSTLPTEFDMNVTAKDESHKNYMVSLKLGDFAPVDIKATFDGVFFSLNLDSTCLDANEKIYIVNLNSVDKKPYQEPVTFNYTVGKNLSMSSGMSIVRKDSIAPDKPKAQLQWYTVGVAKRGGEVVDMSWEGTFKMSAGEVYNLGEGVNYPKDFNLKIGKGDYGYFITEIVGYKLNDNAMMLAVDEANNRKAKISLDYYGMRTLEMVDPGKVYIVLGDNAGNREGDINLTLNDDGSVTVDDFSILRYLFGKTDAPEVLASYTDVKGKKDGQPKPDVPTFSWAQSFKVTADVTMYNNDYSIPGEFTMTVVENEATGGLMMTEFVGWDIAALNYGGAFFQVTDDPMVAEIGAGAYLKMVEPGKFYLVLADMNGSNSPIKVTADAEGNLTFDNFAVMLKNLPENTSSAVAMLKNVKATVVPTGIEAVENGALKVVVAGNSIQLDKAQAVQVYNFSGQCLYNGVTAQVDGLAKGLYIVKTATGVAKVMVR